ncbi:Cyanobacterial phytochrome B [Hypsizygus marmoreus]|uniref:Cyanobacterial phytochrome B n=1 Tax=Hypsizygus marmoreus TaxID=39966 RepID=A0A369J697_HYPMA|nr:Cyanobacterial phytochrome B [Hypsizygus marmoreus]
MSESSTGTPSLPATPINQLPDNPLSSPKVTSHLPFNPSEYGIVHLPPLSPTPRLGAPEKILALPSDYFSGSAFSPFVKPGASADFLKSLPSPDPPPLTGSEPQSESVEHKCISADPSVNFRYEHVEDENGHYIITGWQGKRQDFEEPIRSPGAVQAFGVLIAVEETENALLVRQVSENSTTILGFSPHFLFSLDCFTDILPESEAKLLWDNIQFLNESGNMAEEVGGESPHVFLLSGWGAPEPNSPDTQCERRSWTSWCAVHRPAATSEPASRTSNLIIMEFELEKDSLNPRYPFVPSGALKYGSSEPLSPTQSYDGSELADDIADPNHGHSSQISSTEHHTLPSADEILESTTSFSKPIPALERLRRMQMANNPLSPDVIDDSLNPFTRKSQHQRQRNGHDDIGVGMMGGFAVMGQINEQLGAASSKDSFLKVAVGLVKDLTQFHRTMIYKFDEAWNGQVVAELVDWNQSNDLYKGLHFPAADFSVQTRELYAINKFRLVYDTCQATARIVVKCKEDLELPLNMTHCYLRATSPKQIQYLVNMGARASMSVSIIVSGTLWGLIMCHSYGTHGMRVPPPIRQMLRLLSHSISSNIERLNSGPRISTRQLINTMVSNRHPTGYIVSNVENLLGLFDADFGILVIGEGAKILGPNQHGQEILIMAEYLRLKQYNTIQASESIVHDFPDLQLATNLKVIAGLLLVPLSTTGNDFIAFLRKGERQQIKWAGNPHLPDDSFEPRKSFKVWFETVLGGCRHWTDEQLETAGLLSLVYGKFIEVWRQKENALRTTEVADILLSNAGHEVRTPLNHIVNYLEMALNGPLDDEVREHLVRSHAASKSLLFTINDLLDLTRLESGQETSSHEPFDLRHAIRKATHLYMKEAGRRDIGFHLKLDESPRAVIGDAKKILAVVQNLTANALKYTLKGSITVHCSVFGASERSRNPLHAAVKIVVADTGRGIPPDKLDIIFREFEQVESTENDITGDSGVGLGLAVVARIVEQLGGQLRVESKVDEGTRFSFLIPLALAEEILGAEGSLTEASNSDSSLSQTQDSQPTLDEGKISPAALPSDEVSRGIEATRSQVSSGQTTADNLDLGAGSAMNRGMVEQSRNTPSNELSNLSTLTNSDTQITLRVLVVEDNPINSAILAKRLRLDGHIVVCATNGQEGFDAVKADGTFDVVLMDLQMPILNGFEATSEIRKLEKRPEGPLTKSGKMLSHALSGHLPILAVSASLYERQRGELVDCGMDGGIGMFIVQDIPGRVEVGYEPDVEVYSRFFLGFYLCTQRTLVHHGSGIEERLYFNN